MKQENPNMDEFEAVRDRLTKARPSLPPQLRRAAAYVLENPGDIATLSMRKIAINADVALPNFARLAKEVGFETYNELREVYRKRVQNGEPFGYPERAKNLRDSVESYGSEAVWEAFRSTAFGCVKSVFDQIDALTISNIANELQERQCIYLAGMQASQCFVKYMHYIGGMVSPSMHVIARDGAILGDDLADLGDKDALVCLSLRPCARVTISIAELGRERGALVIGITDSRTSPLASLSDRVLLTSTESPSFFQSNIGATAIIEMLIGFLMIGGGTASIERIRRIEADRRHLGEYWNERDKL